MRAIDCLEATVWEQEDGTLSCPWLDNLSVKRGCEFCYKKLLFEEQAKEEQWNFKSAVAHGIHPDWPNEWATVSKGTDSSGNFIGYEIQYDLYPSLIAAEKAGWTFEFAYFPKFKSLLEQEYAQIKEPNSMTYDRQITLSVGNSRKATNWPASMLFWSELVERLRTPVRGTETLQQYLSYTKGQQDDLKDVGGFVAGTLSGSRRKANAVVSRDVLTLDLDNIPAGGTADVMRRLEGLGCGYCVYSTRKHHEAAPRLRVLVPLYRSCTRKRKT